jgi:hypothetical protein
MKKAGLFILALLIIPQLIGCSLFKKPSASYLDAFGNTYEAKSYESKQEMIIEVNTENASQEVIEDFKDIKRIIFIQDEKIDNDKEKGIISFYLNFGEMPISYDLFHYDGNVYMKHPFKDDRYISYSEEDENNSDIYSETYQELFDIWNEAMREELIVSEGSTVKQTPDGNVKIKLVSVELNDTKLKNILRKVLVPLLKNQEVLKDIIDSIPTGIADMSKEEIEKNIEEYMKNLPENMIKLNNSIFLEDFKVVSGINKDDFIIDQTISGKLTITDKEGGKTVITIESTLTRWNINGNIDMDLPDIKPENIMTDEEIEEMNESFEKFYNRGEEND